ncbi:M48 family metallopeptidase [Bernardetia sp. MNP-M8]|uniref:M48 family metallopeptidase n=1 Tax=Bernardetia sp. MNP-M8 TaxID=3127470 RepID=UPI0030CF1FF7
MNSTSIYRIVFSSIFLLLLFTSSHSFAQKTTLDFNNYQTLEAKGEIPKPFLKRTSDFYETKREKNILTVDKDLEENKDKFDVISSYHLNQLLWSGSVLFGDTITTYVQEVGNKVLENYPDLQGKIYFYVTKEHSVNAFTTPEGFIFVNLGLLAHLDNEAQLAFILAHEITHFTKKHSINQFLYNEEVRNESKGSIARLLSRSKSLYEEQAKKSSYSKEQEIEADDEGWDIFSKTSYDLSEAVAAFEALKNSRYPFDTLVFESKFLNNSYVNLPDSFYYRDVTHFVEMPKLSAKEIEKIKTLQTHPDIEERKKIALTKMASKSENKGDKYLVSEDRFKLAQKIARFELCNLYLQEEQFVDAIYTALILESQYGKSKYSELCIVKALYGLAAYDIYGTRIYLEHPYNEINWKGRNWFYALEDLHHDQLAVLAASHLIEFADKYKEYEYFYYFVPKLFFEEKLQIGTLNLNEESITGEYMYQSTDDRNYIVSLRELVELGVMKEALIKIKNNQKVKDGELLHEGSGLKKGLKKLFELGYSEINTLEEQEEIDRVFNEYITKEADIYDHSTSSFRVTPGTPDFILKENMLLVRPVLVKIGAKKKKESWIDFFDKEQKELTTKVKEYNVMRNEERRFSCIAPDAFTAQDVEKYNDLASLYFSLGSYYSRDAVQQMKLVDIPQLKKLQEKYSTKYLARIIVILDKDDYGVFMQVQNLQNGLVTKEFIRTGSSYYDEEDTWQKKLKELFIY